MINQRVIAVNIETNYEKMYQQAHQWVDEARGVIAQYIDQGPIQHETKSHINDLVTEVDRAVERFLVKKILFHYPDHQIVGEEGTCQSVDHLNGFVWFIDPIDGTSNFVSQRVDFAISIALYHDEVGVFGIIDDVMHDNRYHALRGQGCYKNNQPHTLSLTPIPLIDSLMAVSFHFTSTNKLSWGKKLMEIGPQIRGIRSYGTATLTLVRVAWGQIQGYMVPSLCPWDFAAGNILVTEAGGVVTDFSGNEISLADKTSVLACNRSIHAELLDFIQKLPSHD